MGIFVKMKRPSFQSPLNGFLTAAHVALKRHKDLYDSSSFLSADPDLNDGTYHINHKTTDPQIIGRVREAFFGNLNSVGIDAAFVETQNIKHGKIAKCVRVVGVCEYVFLILAINLVSVFSITLIKKNVFKFYALHL